MLKPHGFVVSIPCGRMCVNLRQMHRCGK